MTASDTTFLQLILVGLDGSRGSREALDWAVKLARATGARVLAAHVLTYNRELIGDLTFDTIRSWRRDLERDFRTEWTEPLTAAGIDHDCEFVEGESPAEGLLDLAERQKVDLLVVGSRGRGGLVGRVLGSTSYKLAHHTQPPVVVVPSGWERHQAVA